MEVNGGGVMVRLMGRRQERGARYINVWLTIVINAIKQRQRFATRPLGGAPWRRGWCAVDGKEQRRGYTDLPAANGTTASV